METEIKILFHTITRAIGGKPSQTIHLSITKLPSYHSPIYQSLIANQQSQISNLPAYFFTALIGCSRSKTI